MRNKADDGAVRLCFPLLLCVLSATGWAAAQIGPVTNTASVSYTEGVSGSPITVSSNQTVTAITPAVTLSVVKSVTPAGAVAPGTTITFRLVLENPSNADFSGVVVSDPLDPLFSAPLTFSDGSLPDLAHPGDTVTVAGTWLAGVRTMQWSVATLPSGARIALTFSTMIDPAAPDDSIASNLSTHVSVQDPAGGSSNLVTVPVVAPSLQIRKDASRSRAEVGDVVGYTVEVSNISALLDLTAARVRDRLPDGFRFLKGSARLDGQAIPDPAGSEAAGAALVFDLGVLPFGQSRRLTYVAVPNPEAEGEDGVNRAWADAVTPAGSAVSAGPAEASVRVSGSLLSGEATLVGRVFVDDNRNGVLDEGEPGVPWVRVYLEDGSFTITDVVGKYHIEGVRPGLHVVKVDQGTLPDGLGPLQVWSRSAGGASTQFADMRADQMFKTNIASAGWGLSVARLRARALYRKVEGETTPAAFPPVLASAVFEGRTADISRTGREVVEAYAAIIRERGGRLAELRVEPSCFPLDATELMEARAQRFEGEIRRLVLAAAPTVPGGQESPEALASVPSARGSAPVASAATDDNAGLEALVKEMTPEAAVLTPAEGTALHAERTLIEVKLPLDLMSRLTVNDHEVPQDRIAVRMETSQSRVQFLRYLGVPLREGRNTIVLEGIDQWGNTRAWVERIVHRSGKPAAVSLRPEEGSLTADGRSPLVLHAEVRDALGLPVLDGTVVTLHSDRGEFLGGDADVRAEGYQVVTRDGVALARLSPAATRENRTIRAAAGDAMAETTLALSPVMGPWLVAGMGEASVGHAAPGSARTVTEMLDDDGNADGRFAVFARGPLFGTSLMTLAYDSGRQRDEDQVFRKIAPDRYFPIYGDSSRQGYEVESQGKFSLRLDQRRSSLALGDFTTALSGGDLARYDRALTGAAGRLDLNGFTVQSFGARTPQTQVRDELEGAGISGPYRLTRSPLVINSEQVIIETRERYHPDRVVERRAMARYADYDVDYEGGSLLFKRPIPFQDESFNTVVIVVTYEALDAGGDETVAGGRLAYRFGEAAELGTTYVSEQRGDGDYILRGADFKMRRMLGVAALELSGEGAASTSVANEVAGAFAFRAAAQLGGSVKVGAWLRRVSSGFENPSRGGLSDSGTMRWGVDGNASLGPTSRLRGEFYSDEDERLDRERRVGLLEWEKVIGRFTTRAGLRGVRSPEPATQEIASTGMVTAGLRTRLVKALDATLFRQQVVSGPALPDEPTRTAVGLDWQATDDLRAFVRQELDQSIAGDASRTVVGMESRLLRHLTLESRYSLEDALSGERGAAQLGLKSRLPLNQDWLGDFSAERVAVVRGVTTTGDFTSLGMGFEYLPARVKFTTRYELRLGDLDDQHVLTAGGATRLTDGLSLFARQRLFLVNPANDGSRLDGDGLLGLAYRPMEDDRLNLLFKLQGTKGEAAGIGSASARSYLGLMEIHYQPVARLHLLGRLAARDQLDRFEGETFSSRSTLGETRFLVDIASRYNAGASVRVLHQQASGSRVLGYGVETGARLMKDMWLVGGYNFTGFEERGFGDNDRRSAGGFVTIRFKFDEGTFAGLSQELRKRDGSPGRLEPAMGTAEPGDAAQAELE